MGEEEFDAFFSVSHSRLVGQLYAMTGDWAQAQRVVLEAFVRAWDHRAQMDVESAPDSWIRSVAWHLAGLQRRFGAESAAENGAPAGAERVAFVEAVRRLREEERRAVVLHFLCNVGVEDVAAETGLSVGAVAAGLTRGRSALVVAGDGVDRCAELADELYDFANRHAQPRFDAQRVREQGDQRRLKRRSATIGGVGALALAGVILVALLAGKPTPPTVAPSAGHPTGVHHIDARQSPS